MLELCARVCDACAAECESMTTNIASYARRCAENAQRIAGTRLHRLAVTVRFYRSDRNALVVAGRVEGREVKLQRLADPVRQRSVVGEVVVGQRVNESAKT